MIFATPVFESQAFTAAYIFTALLIYTLGYTVFNVPYISMPAEMTDSYHERSSIHGYRVIFVSIGGMLAGAVAPAVLEQLGRTSWSAYAIVGSVGSLIIFTSLMVAWAGTGKARFTSAAAERPKLLAELRQVFANRHFIRLLSVKAAQLLGVASMQAAMVFFVLNVMQRDFGILAIYGLVIGISSLVVVPILVSMSRAIGKSNTYIFAALCFVVVVLSWMFAGPDEPTWVFVLRGIVVAFAASGNVIMAMSMLTDIINHAAKESGVRREGVYTSFYSFVEKFTFAFGPLIVGIALSISGFDETIPPEQMQSPAIRQALLVGMTYIPASMGILSIVLLTGYKLREEDMK